MSRCHVCGRLRATIGRCVCGAAVLVSLALGEPHAERQQYNPPPVATVEVLSTATGVLGRHYFLNADPGVYLVNGYAVALSTQSSQGT